MAEAYLILFWVAFFRKFIAGPYTYCTGEHLENYFSYWRYLGEQVRNCKGWFRDSFYYYEPGGIPFMCAWYPPQILTAFFGSFFAIDFSFILYTLQLFAHYLFASFFAYYLFDYMGYAVWISLIGATALTYATRFVNLNGALAYTPCWLPFILWACISGHPILAGIGIYMMFSAGYTTMFLYLLPVIAVFLLKLDNPFLAISVSSILCAPQLAYTVNYMRKTVRGATTYEQRAIGSVPPWHFISLIFPIHLNMNNVLYVEYVYRVGRVILLGIIFASNWMLGIAALFCCYMMMGKYVKAPIVLRIPAKWSYLLSVILIFLGVEGLIAYQQFSPLLLALHSADLIFTHPGIMKIFPFTEYPVKPSKAFSGELATHSYVGKASGLPWPLRAGYINKIKTLGYKGGSSLKSTAKFFGYDSNGCSSHDWFDMKDGDDGIEEYGVSHAYTHHKLSDHWKETEVSHLYEWHSI